MNGERAWQVLLFGGASGVGKTSVSYRLAQHYGVGITEVDDFQVILEGMTTPEQQPVLHYWRTHPDEARRMDEEQQLATCAITRGVMCRCLELVIANHMESRAPIVLEGDFLLPALAVQPAYNGIAAEGQVRAVFLYEDDEAQLRPQLSAARGRGAAAAGAGELAAQRVAAPGSGAPGRPGLAARPWETVLERVIAALEDHGVTSPPPGQRRLWCGLSLCCREQVDREGDGHDDEPAG